MREIKFRAFEKTLNEMIPVHNIDFNKRMINTNSAWRIFDEIELMQYTGLKDKNGVEIYEGDFLKTPTEKVGQVFFHANGGWLVETKEYEFNLAKITATGQSEIIGNIHENPELLEVSTE